MGDTRSILKAAFGALSGFLEKTRISSVYRTAPRYVVNQPAYRNAAAAGYTNLEPFELLRRTQEIEAAFGRDRSRESVKGPRTLDIDILLYGKEIIDMPGLAVPHPGLCERLFALVPLLELEPGLRDPRSGLFYADIAGKLPDQGVYLDEPPGL